MIIFYCMIQWRCDTHRFFQNFEQNISMTVFGNKISKFSIVMFMVFTVQFTRQPTRVGFYDYNRLFETISNRSGDTFAAHLLHFVSLVNRAEETTFNFFSNSFVNGQKQVKTKERVLTTKNTIQKITITSLKS